MMDAYQGYHQVQLFRGDKPKVSFIVLCGTYVYVRMSFGLINAGGTYQQMVDKVFYDLLGQNVEVYVNDMLVKSVKAEGHVEDLRRPSM